MVDRSLPKRVLHRTVARRRDMIQNGWSIALLDSSFGSLRFNSAGGSDGEAQHEDRLGDCGVHLGDGQILKSGRQRD